MLTCMHVGVCLHVRYFRPETMGNYSFQIQYTQRGQLDVNGHSIGSLEEHNPGALLAASE